MKKKLRKEILEKRLQLSEEEITTKSSIIFNTLCHHENFIHAKTIMLFMDFRKEVQTHTIINYCLLQDKHIILPLVDEKKENLILMEIYTLKEDMIMSSYGILEPLYRADRIRNLNTIDLVLAPGVAFDSNGYRLGYGGGFYDKLLANRNDTLKVWGLAFDLQIVDSVPHEHYDQKIDGIITETRIIHC